MKVKLVDLIKRLIRKTTNYNKNVRISTKGLKDK